MTSNADYLSVVLPNGDVMITCVSKARKASLKALASINHVMVTISKPSRGEPYVSAVQWPGESKPEQSEPSNRGIYLGAGYFVLGLLGLCYTMQPSVFASVLLGLCFALPMGMLFSMLSKSFGPWKS